VHLILGLLNLKLNAQNLVPNYSFEVYTSCPTSSSQVSFAVPWTGTNNSTDYFNSCAPPCFISVPCQNSISFQYAKTGDAFAGMWFLHGLIDYREYLQTKLLDTLLPSMCYKVSFFLNNHNSAKYAINNFGVYFSTDTFTTVWNPAPYIPQVLGFNNEIINDTLNWIEISGLYIANGGEEYITIGNFSDDANTDTLDTGNGTSSGGAYYFIDDVSVIPIDSIIGGMPAYAGADTNVILGDSVFIGQKISNLNCNWYDSNGDLIASNISGTTVNPTTSTYFVVEQNLCGNITYDTVNVTVLPTSINELLNSSNMKVYPNPNNGTFTITHNLNGKNYVLEIIDLMGKIVYGETLTTTKQEIKTQQLNTGLYFVNFKSNTGELMYSTKMSVIH
jgi:hypothetical protein